LFAVLVCLTFRLGAARADEPEHPDGSAETADTDVDDTDDAPPTAEDKADLAELDTLEAGMPHDVEEGALDKRPEASDLAPSIDVETFRKIVRLTKRQQLDRMEKKMLRTAAKRMTWFTLAVSALSLAGILLLVTPLVLRKKYPGQGKVLFKYSALAAVTFFVTVNLFGGVLLMMRTAQTALGPLANPTLAIASGTFDTLDTNAEEYITTGKELFVPTLEQIKANPDEQPAVLLLENGTKVVKDATVFVRVANLFKKVSFVFEIVPLVLLAMTLLLFLLALRPTLTEIIKLPALAAQGAYGAGREVVKRSLKRVGTELVATVCTIGVLFAITLVTSFVLGRVVAPALDTLLGYFSASVVYLQFAQGASSALVFAALFGVILFLVLNLASLIASTVLFLGKSQKIFQQRWNDGIPLSAHRRFWRWGIPSVLLVQLFPWLFVTIAARVLDKINDSILGGAGSANEVAWAKLMLAGPLFLVVGFVLALWAVRGVKAIRFLASYQVKVESPGIPAGMR
jgi:hypothetical protein